jgi:hypothetical protein
MKIMNLTCREIAGIINALEARIEWMEDNPDQKIQEELPHLRMAREKMVSLGFHVKGEKR